MKQYIRAGSLLILAVILQGQTIDISNGISADSEKLVLSPIDLDAIPEYQLDEESWLKRENNLRQSVADSMNILFSIEKERLVRNLTEKETFHLHAVKDSLEMLYKDSLASLLKPVAADNTVLIDRLADSLTMVCNNKLMEAEQKYKQLYIDSLNAIRPVKNDTVYIKEEDSIIPVNEAVYETALYKYLVTLSSEKGNPLFFWQNDPLNTFKMHEYSAFLSTYFPHYHSGSVMILKAKLLLDEKRTDEAILTYFKYLCFFPGHNNYSYGLEEYTKLLAPAEKRTDFELGMLRIADSLKTSRGNGDPTEIWIRQLLKYTGQNALPYILNEFDTYIAKSSNHIQKDELISEMFAFLIRNGKLRESQLTADKLELLFPNSTLRAKVMLKSITVTSEKFKDYAQAIEQYGRFIHEFPDHPFAAGARFARAKLYEEKLKQPLNAIEEYRLLTEEYPQAKEVVYARFARAELYMRTAKSYDSAIIEYQTVVKDFPRDTLYVIKSYQKMAELYLAVQKDSLAIGMLMKIVHDYPQASAAPEALYKMAGIYEKQAEHAVLALNYYRQIREQYSDNSLAGKAVKKIAAIEKAQAKLNKDVSNNESSGTTEENSGTVPDSTNGNP